MLFRSDWTEEEVAAEVERALTSVNRTKFFIPSLTSGLNNSGYPGVYQAVTDEIAKLSPRFFA